MRSWFDVDHNYYRVLECCSIIYNYNNFFSFKVGQFLSDLLVNKALELLLINIYYTYYTCCVCPYIITKQHKHSVLYRWVRCKLSHNISNYSLHLSDV